MKNTAPMIEPLRVSVPEAGRILGLSRMTVWRLIAKGKIRPVRDGKRTLFTMTELRSYVARTDPAADEHL